MAMERFDDIAWSKQSYAINDVIDSDTYFPVLVKITRGYYGIQEDDTVDTDQILVLNDCGEETCVLANNQDDCWISIPLNHLHRFEKLSTDGTPRSPGQANTEMLTLRNLLKRYTLSMKVRFDPNMYTSFLVANQQRNSEEFGDLTLLSTHSVKYVHAFPVFDGEVQCSHAIIIPNYRDVRFVMAGANQPTVKTFLETANKNKPKQEPIYSQTLSIVGYEDMDLADEEYDLVIPKKPIKVPKGQESTGNSESKSQPGTPPTVKSPPGTPPPGNVSKRATALMECFERDYLNMDFTRGTSGVPLFLGKGLKADDKCSILGRTSSTAIKPSNVRPPLALPSGGLKSPPKPPPKSKSLPKGFNPPSMPRSAPPIIQSEPASMPHDLRFGGFPPDGAPDGAGTDDDIYETCFPAQRQNARLKSLGDVPEDLSAMSVTDVGECLRLLNLEKHVSRFEQEQVDGSLLLECSSEDLVGMGLIPLHAKKLIKFAHGWRPRL